MRSGLPHTLDLAYVLADTFIHTKEKRRDPFVAIQAIRSLKECHSRNLHRSFTTFYIHPIAQRRYHDALNRLVERAEITDRNLHDWFFIFPASILSGFIRMIETTRLQARMLLSTRRQHPMYILSSRTIAEFTASLMDAELLVLAIQDFKTAIAAHFGRGQQSYLVHTAIRDALYRFLRDHHEPLVAEGDLEAEMRLRLQKRVPIYRVLYTPDPASPRIDVYPYPPPPATSSQTASSSNPSTSSQENVGDKRRRHRYDEDISDQPSKRRSTDERSGSTSSDTAQESDTDSGLASSEDYSEVTEDSDEYSEDVYSDSSSVVAEYAYSDTETDSSDDLRHAPLHFVPVPPLHFWWSVVKDIFQIFTP
ncbi:hypothetical protein EIP91_007474 [Steccherinum ochraceum]|uniref:Uncharacterized protein n=1 Tax=Steccherinum ochraceum TaxID=92696 RepID=A0A4R0RCI3_9APHY|nr:hypothetical protein EIP91_007474 [Steccherinum ochraceum]